MELSRRAAGQEKARWRHPVPSRRSEPSQFCRRTQQQRRWNQSQGTIRDQEDEPRLPCRMPSSNGPSCSATPIIWEKEKETTSKSSSSLCRRRNHPPWRRRDTTPPAAETVAAVTAIPAAAGTEGDPKAAVATKSTARIPAEAGRAGDGTLLGVVERAPTRGPRGRRRRGTADEAHATKGERRRDAARRNTIADEATARRSGKIAVPMATAKTLRGTLGRTVSVSLQQQLPQ